MFESVTITRRALIMSIVSLFTCGALFGSWLVYKEVPNACPEEQLLSFDGETITFRNDFICHLPHEFILMFISACINNPGFMCGIGLIFLVFFVCIYDCCAHAAENMDEYTTALEQDKQYVKFIIKSRILMTESRYWRGVHLIVNGKQHAFSRINTTDGIVIAFEYEQQITTCHLHRITYQGNTFPQIIEAS